MSERLSFRAKPQASVNEYGVWGYYNRFGGFHRMSDPYAYTLLLRSLAKNLHHKQVARWVVHMIWDRWKHRRCDTVDFHHYACTLDKFGRKMDDEYRWKKVWTGAS